MANEYSRSKDDIARELPTRVIVYKDGTVQRLKGSPYTPPSLNHPTTLSKDITISNHLSARLYLPAALTQPQNIPILLYFHGGAFCLESAFTLLHHTYLNLLVSKLNVLVVSVDYSLAPENPLPAAYEDSLTALSWLGSNHDPWILNHGHFGKIFVGGDSAGGNIVHNLVMKAGGECSKLKIYGAFLGHPYFWGSEPVGSECKSGHEEKDGALVWGFVYPNAENGVDNVLVNPAGPGAPSLEGIGCSKILVFVAEKDELRDRGVWYYDLVKKSGWKGEIELVEVKDEGHVFYIRNPESANAAIMMERLSSFLVE